MSVTSLGMSEMTLAAAITPTSRVQIAVQDLHSKGFKAEAMVADVTDLSVFAAMIEARPAFQILVNNAGDQPFPPAVRHHARGLRRHSRPQSAGCDLCAAGSNATDAC